MPTEATDQQTGETEEQSQGAVEAADDQAGSDESGVSADGQRDSETTEESIELLGQEEYDKLASNPAALRKALNKAATQKFQEIASHRKVLEPYVDIISGLETDPRSTVIELAKSLGINLAEAAPAAAVKEKVADFATQVSEILSQQLGDEYGDLSAKLAPAITKVAQMVAAESIRPLAEAQETLIRDTALREAGNAMAAFDKEVPGWRKYEKRMTELSNHLEPKGMSELEYLRVLHAAATAESGKAVSIKGVLAKMTSAAKTTEKPTPSVSGDKVTRKAGTVTFAEAAAAARRGERFED